MTPYTTTALRIPVLTSRGASHRMVAARFRNLHTSRRTFEPPPFRPPPIRERLRPLIPFFIWWSIITSLTVHLLRARQSSKEMQSRSEAKISVLESLLGRTRAGEALTEEEVERQLEMVGLRERRTGDLGEKREDIRDVGWMEAIFGRKGRDQVVDKTAKEDEEDVAAWAKSGTYGPWISRRLHRRIFWSGRLIPSSGHRGESCR